MKRTAQLFSMQCCKVFALWRATRAGRVGARAPLKGGRLQLQLLVASRKRKERSEKNSAAIWHAVLQGIHPLARKARGQGRSQGSSAGGRPPVPVASGTTEAQGMQ